MGPPTPSETSNEQDAIAGLVVGREPERECESLHDLGRCVTTGYEVSWRGERHARRLARDITVKYELRQTDREKGVERLERRPSGPSDPGLYRTNQRVINCTLVDPRES